MSWGETETWVRYDELEDFYTTATAKAVHALKELILAGRVGIVHHGSERMRMVTRKDGTSESMVSSPQAALALFAIEDSQNPITKRKLELVKSKEVA